MLSWSESVKGILLVRLLVWGDYATSFGAVERAKYLKYCDCD